MKRAEKTKMVKTTVEIMKVADEYLTIKHVKINIVADREKTIIIPTSEQMPGAAQPYPLCSDEQVEAMKKNLVDELTDAEAANLYRLQQEGWKPSADNTQS